MLELAALLLALFCVLAAFWVIRTLAGLLAGLAFLVPAVFILLLFWVPGPLEPFLGPVQGALRSFLGFLGQAFGRFAEMVRIFRSS